MPSKNSLMSNLFSTLRCSSVATTMLARPGNDLHQCSTHPSLKSNDIRGSLKNARNMNISRVRLQRTLETNDYSSDE